MLEERALRLAEEKGAAAARERERLARDVHDILAEQMVGDGVTGFAIFGHSNPLRRRSARICRMRAPLALSHGAFALVKAQSI